MRFMKNTPRVVGLMLLGLLLTVSAPASATEDLGLIPISGTIGLAQAEQNSCFAVWVPVADDMAISGIKWYNNDSAVAFPGILVQSGTADYPVSLTDAFQVAEAVVGESAGWSEVEFSEPVASSGEGLYVIFQVPPEGRAVSEGLGGGPAIGYTPAASGYTGWLSADGEDWVQVHPDYGFAVRPVLVASTPGMFSKSTMRPNGEIDDTGSQSRAVTKTMMKPAVPNPFNPQTTMSFSLSEDSRVELVVYNLKGELVKRLLSQVMQAGEHTAVWSGRDHRGAAVASGVYFAKFAADGIVMTQRLVLVQ